MDKKYQIGIIISIIIISIIMLIVFIVIFTRPSALSFIGGDTVDNQINKLNKRIENETIRLQSS